MAPSYLAARNRQLLVRLRWAVGLGSTGGLVFAGFACLGDTATRAAHVRVALDYTLASLAVGALALLPGAARRASALGVAYVLALTVIMAGFSAALPDEAALTPAVLVAIMFGTTLLLPWGAGPQAIVCAGALAGFAWVAAMSDLGPVAPAASLIMSSAVVSVVGARLVDRYEAASHEQTWVQEQLVASARAFASGVDVDAIVEAMLAHAAALVPASSVVVALHDARRAVLRVVGATGGAQSTLGLEVPDSLEPVQEVLAAPLLRLPEDRPASPINALIASTGSRHVLYATLRHTGQPVGVLAFVRRTEGPFSEAEQRIVRGLAEQAALALATARLVDDLRDASRLKTEFVSTMSHELRTPLNVILGLADMLDDDTFGPEERRDLVGRVRVAGRDLLELIENTLAIGRMDAGRDDLRLEDVWLPELWTVLHERCARMPRRPAVALVWGDGTRVRLRTDPHKLSVVVANLVSNALKFTEHGRVEVTAESTDGAVTIRVADTGIGIAAADHGHVFDMFRQVDSSDSRRYGGTGLGLYIVRRFVEQLGGTVQLESAPDRGSTFTVRLPDADAKRAPANGADAPPRRKVA
jgi:signal transduction histidine kinase